ncbi:uncharacterized protein TNCT_250921 [Trichonephila clavata]|uniref:Uncharacterized protein n=1 Tax=Trichonephila clavata TaxID=2740835 RepID=A0A8X6HP90_TRICU|nr:uncharacterized protein TNCT_250921 [Trichonephila clavata]
MKICNEYATRCPGMPSHPKFRSRVFCLCSHMTTWTSEHNLQDSYSVWYNRASNLSHAVVMDNYWALLGSLALITNKIAKIQKNFVMYTENEFSQVKRALKKELKTIEKACSANVPILADSVRDTEKRFHVIVQRCNTLRL